MAFSFSLQSYLGPLTKCNFSARSSAVTTGSINAVSLRRGLSDGSKQASSNHTSPLFCEIVIRLRAQLMQSLGEKFGGALN
jgi:hypothetical protein